MKVTDDCTSLHSLTLDNLIMCNSSLDTVLAGIVIFQKRKKNHYKYFRKCKMKSFIVNDKERERQGVGRERVRQRDR